jgi:hypothetical protein
MKFLLSDRTPVLDWIRQIRLRNDFISRDAVTAGNQIADATISPTPVVLIPI